MDVTVKGCAGNQAVIEQCSLGEELRLVPESDSKSVAVLSVRRLNGDPVGWVFASRLKNNYRVCVGRIEGHAKRPIGNRNLIVSLAATV